MSYADCIKSNPALTDANRERLVNKYNELVERYRKTLGDAVAAQAAADGFIRREEAMLVKKLENDMRDVVAWRDLNARHDKIASDIAAEKSKHGRFTAWLWGNPQAAATRNILERAAVSQHALEESVKRSMYDLVEKYRSKSGGLIQNTEEFKEVIRAVLGGKVDNPDLMNDAKAIRETLDLLHKMYNNSGGFMGYIANYFMQHHSPTKIDKIPKDEWKRFIRDLLDEEKMRVAVSEYADLRSFREDMGGIKRSFAFEEEFDRMLDSIYDTITTQGLNEVAARASEGRVRFGNNGGVAMRHSAERFLHFKNADSFLIYNQRFGAGDDGLFEVMMNHIHSMTRDISLMREFGPKPELQMIRLNAKMEAAGVSSETLDVIGDMWNVLSGRAGITGVEPIWYRATRDVQNVLRAAYLVGAPISSLSDGFYTAAAAKNNGLPATKALKTWASMLNPLSSKDRMQARRMFFVSSVASANSIKSARSLDDVSGSHRWSQLLSGATHRLTGMAAIVDAARTSTPLSAQAFMADASDSSMMWDELPQAMRDAFARWDMDEGDYMNIITSNKTTDAIAGGTFIRPENVAAAGRLDTAVKYDKWLNDMAMEASNEPRLLTKAIAGQGMASGTSKRLMRSSVMMFRSFSITVMINHTLPALRDATNGRYGRLAGLTLILPIFGAMSMQARNLIYGKEPEDMDKPQFYAKALIQGGGTGIFGDMVTAGDRGIEQAVGGPLVALTSDIVNVGSAMFDEEKNVGTEISKINIFPFKYWYVRLVMERMILDQLNKAIDPTFDQRVRRAEKKMKEETGAEYWWRPGELEPE